MAIFSFFQRFFVEKRLPASAACLFAGLGNPGEGYAKTRHNVGFRVAERLGNRLENGSHGRSGSAVFQSGMLFANQTVVIRPTTFMNLSGEAVAAYCRRCGVEPSKALVIVDDFNLPLGRLRARRSGSDGGHNGLKSVTASIGSDFPRLRVGIGPVPAGVAVIDFVLGRFTEAEEEMLGKVIPLAVDACVVFAREGIGAVMDRYNG